MHVQSIKLKYECTQKSKILKNQRTLLMQHSGSTQNKLTDGRTNVEELQQFTVVCFIVDCFIVDSFNVDCFTVDRTKPKKKKKKIQTCQ